MFNNAEKAKNAPKVLIEMSRIGQKYKEEMDFTNEQCSECLHSLYEVNKSETKIDRICKLGGFKICSLGTCKEFTREIK